VIHNINLITKRIDSILEQTPKSYSIYKQLKVHREFLIESIDFLKNFNHTVAFIGKIGVGKTTAISKLLNLFDSNGRELLQTGGGRTTICEVEIRDSNHVSIEIEPYSNNEVEKYLEEFSLHIANKALETSKKREEPFTLSSEIERALRNMLKLKIKRFKDNGVIKRVDEAIELYNSYQSKDEFYLYLLKRINLSNRNIKKIAPQNLDDRAEWIKNNFKNINNGNNDSVSLPKKIVINYNKNYFNIPKINLSIVDTKGVDETANREDIEKQLKDSRTISVLCTSFNDAPDKVSTDIIRYMKESGLTKYISTRVIILVLDKAGEAESIIDLDEPDLEEGREIRKEQIESDLKNSLNLDNIKIVFFNSKEDNPQELSQILTDKILFLRKEHENQVKTIIQSLDEIERQVHTQLSLDALHRVKESILIWIKKANSIHCKLKKNFSSISETILDKGTHVSSVRACVNRNGQWHNLDYYKILADSSRYQAVRAFDKSKFELGYIISNMLEQKDLYSQKGILTSIQNILDKRVENMYQYAYEQGKKDYFDNLFFDYELWLNMQKEWGKGAGYKNRIKNHTEQWFLNQDYTYFDNKNSQELNQMWKNLLFEINSLINNK